MKVHFVRQSVLTTAVTIKVSKEKPMNIKELKAMIAVMPDDAPVLIGNGDHGYDEISSVWAKTALVKEPTFGRSKIYTEDIYDSSVIGEQTEYGVRIVALCLE